MEQSDRVYRMLCEELGRAWLTEKEVSQVILLIHTCGQHFYEAAKLLVS